eukprot:1161956-Pelagomonas_calceolata.AAC.2
MNDEYGGVRKVEEVVVGKVDCLWASLASLHREPMVQYELMSMEVWMSLGGWLWGCAYLRALASELLSLFASKMGNEHRKWRDMVGSVRMHNQSQKSDADSSPVQSLSDVFLKS